MLNIKREQQGNTLILSLSGMVIEDVDFDAAIGETAPDTVLNCREISRLNSLGVKKWILYFETQKAKGTHLRFQECSPAVVEQINLIRNFTCGGKVESIYVPFACTGCKKGLVGLFTVEDLRKTGTDIPPVKCHHCGSPAVFDDIPDEYFRFIDR